MFSLLSFVLRTNRLNAMQIVLLWWFRSRVGFGVQQIDGYASEDALSNGHMLAYFDRVRSLQLCATTFVQMLF